MLCHAQRVTCQNHPDTVTTPSYLQDADADDLHDDWNGPTSQSDAVLSALDDPEFLPYRAFSQPSPHRDAALPPFSTSADPFHEDWLHWELKTPAT